HRRREAGRDPRAASPRQRELPGASGREEQRRHRLGVAQDRQRTRTEQVRDEEEDVICRAGSVSDGRSSTRRSRFRLVGMIRARFPMHSKLALLIPGALLVGLLVARPYSGGFTVPEDFPARDRAEIGPAAPAPAGGTELATFGSGCFWCTEAVFQQMKGVKKVVSGYSGGSVPNPTYEQVCDGNTGHAEVVQVTFDPAVVSYPQLLEVFWRSHDSTTPNRQGNDVGTQYRSVIFTHNDRQKELAERYKRKIDEAGAYAKPL